MVFYKVAPQNGEWLWVMIVNPVDIVNRLKAALPNLMVEIGDRSYSLHEIIKRLVLKDGSTDF